LSTVNTISVENTYDIDICRALKNEAALVGINIESSHTFWPDTKNVKELFNKIISGSKNLRSFHDSLWCCCDIRTRHGFWLIQKRSANIWNAVYANISDLAVYILYFIRSKIMKGIISVTPTTIPSKNKYPDFVRRWIAQNVTIRHRNSDTTKDDNGTTYLYQGHANGNSSSPYTFAGLNFSPFTKMSLILVH